MNESDDITVLAFAYVRDEAEIGEKLRGSLEAIPRAPLARLIDAYLDQHKSVSANDLFQKIADLNQGRMEDLNAPAFLSYLIGKCQTDESSMVQVINTLRTFEMVLNASADGYDSDLLIAARSESDEEKQLALEELREQLRKRTK